MVKVTTYCGQKYKHARLVVATLKEWDDNVAETRERKKSFKSPLRGAHLVFTDLEKVAALPACLKCDQAFNQSEIAL